MIIIATQDIRETADYNLRGYSGNPALDLKTIIASRAQQIRAIRHGEFVSDQANNELFEGNLENTENYLDQLDAQLALAKSRYQKLTAINMQSKENIL